MTFPWWSCALAEKNLEFPGRLIPELVLPRPDDFHVHLRQEPALALYVRRQALMSGRALVMPNTLPPIADAAALGIYRQTILDSLEPGSSFTPLMSFKILPGMDARTVTGCIAAGAVAGKYYPSGSTTHAADGPRNPAEVAGVLDAMQDAGIVLSIHGELPEAPALEREEAFLPVLESLLEGWPRMKIVLEHLSSAAAVDFVFSGPERLAASVTAHHLLFSIDDLLGGGLNPHLFCKPVLKTAADRARLRDAVFSGSPKFFFGSDSAPHPRTAKESAQAPGGIYAAPTALPALVELFETLGAVPSLFPFLSGNGARFYGLPAPEGFVRLVRQPWTVPAEIDGVVPMCAGQTLAWQLS